MKEGFIIKIIGFIGLGKMGGGLAKNLIRANYDVVLYDLNPEAIHQVQEVGGRKGSIEQIAHECDVVFTSLPRPQHLMDLLVHKDKLIDKLKKETILIDVSTTDPNTARDINEEALKKNISFLACPLGKGPAQAEEATQPIFVGGEVQAFNDCQPMLEKIGNPVTYLGNVEQATAFKLISNMMGMANLAVLSEGIRIAKEFDIDLPLFKELIHDTGAESAQMQLRSPLIIKDQYDCMFSVELAEKDVRLGKIMAEDKEISTKFTDLTLKHLEQAMKQNYNNMDVAAIYRTF